MSSTRLMGLILAVSVVGCASHRKQVLPPPATPFTAEEMQSEFQRIDPSTRVGLVAAVQADNHLAAVSHLDTSEFRSGDTISFIDTNKDLVGHGTVVRTVDDLLIVQYQTNTRPLRKGDLAVRVRT